MTLFNSSEPIEVAQQNFVETCLGAIREADKVLLTKGNWFLCGSQSNRSYTTQRNALRVFLTSLASSQSQLAACQSKTAPRA